MTITTQSILTNVEYGTPSGNYDGSSLDFVGEDQKAADYYGGFGQLQTLAFYLSEFQGRIRIQATLDSVPAQDVNWFQVYDFNSADSTATTNNFSVNITGNFTWIRSRVEEFEAGTVTKLMMSY